MNGRKNSNALLTICVFMLVLPLATRAAADTHYVNPGESIQSAIDSASYGDMVQVAADTYHQRITLKNGVALIGAGAEATIINGDASGSVVTSNGCDPNTLLQGFTITNGAAGKGGGMYNYGGSPTVIDCIFSGNKTINQGVGGGMYNEGSSPTVTNCTFSSNLSPYGKTGGMHNDNSSPMVDNCTFSNNNAEWAAGGMSNYNNSSPTVTNCTFTGNSTSDWGTGGMYNVYSSPTVTNCTFTGNRAEHGSSGTGGIQSYESSSTVTNCVFSGNRGQNGGGMCGDNDKVANCIFVGNHARYQGGGITFAGSTTVSNCTFSGNSTFYARPEYDWGGGAIYYFDAGPTVTNCVLLANTPNQILVRSGTGNPVVTYSNVQDGTGQPWFGTGCIDADPRFVDAGGGDFRLLSWASPCVDAGDNGAAGLPATDLSGNPRITDGDGDGSAVVDMGAFELNGPVRNITKNRLYSIIQVAIEDAANGDQIELPPGSYNETIDFKGRAISLYSSGGAELTTLDATGLDTSVVTFASGEGPQAVLEGFTITGGNTTAGGGIYCKDSSPTVTSCIIKENNASRGGGMYNDASSPTVTNCKFSGNLANEGAGMENDNNSNPSVTNCTYTDNAADYGGGMYNRNSNPMVTNCTFSGNLVSEWGGGIYNQNSNATVRNCILWYNFPDEIIDAPGSTTTVTYSNIRGSWPGEGNIDVIPWFVACADGTDLCLSQRSLCVDAGNNGTPGLPENDLAGNPRVMDGDGDGAAVVDMGAYEHQYSIPPTRLQVAITPQEAIDAGAAWRLVGQTQWRDSNDTIYELAPEYYDVEFKELEAWSEPKVLSVRVTGGVPVREAGEYKAIPLFDIGQIPPRDVAHGQSLEFYVEADWLAEPLFTMDVNGQPEGLIWLDTDSGLFTYEPDDVNDRRPFEVTFIATSGGDVNEQKVEITPVPDLPPEYSIISRPSEIVPDESSRDYTFNNEIVSDTTELFNGLYRPVRSVTISGKTVVFEDGLFNTSYGPYSYSEPNCIADIHDMTIYAETLIIRDRLHLPQTEVTIYARDLRFEDDGSIETTPVDDRPPGTEELDGLRGGDITLYIESYDPGCVRLTTDGTKGQNGGRPGDFGRITCAPLQMSQPLGWLTPYALKMVVAHAKDAYLYGHVVEARDILQEYYELLDTYMAISECEQWRFEFEQMHHEISTLLHRIQNGFDYFGNPPDWVPMLSFEVLKEVYEDEINHAIRVLYLSYWIQNKAEDLTQTQNALKTGREKLWEQTEQFWADYKTVAGIIHPLEDEAADIVRKIGRADAGGCSGLLCQLKQKEAELLERAERIIEERHKVPWWKKAMRVTGAILKSVTLAIDFKGPFKAATAIEGGLAGLSAALYEIPEVIDDPWPEISSRTDVAKQYNSVEFDDATKKWLADFNNIGDLSDIEAYGAEWYLQSMRSDTARMAGGLYDIKETLMTTLLSNEEVEAELRKIKAKDPQFTRLVNDVTELMVQKEAFNRKLAALMQRVSTLSGGITNNLLAIDAMNRDASHLNRILDPNAIMYVKDMERRALERLQKYHYYMAKAYEYRLLKPYPEDLNILAMFTKIQNIADTSTDANSLEGNLGSDDFDALKVVYEEQLRDLTETIIDEFMAGDYEWEMTTSYRLSLQEINQLNDTGEVAINLLEKGLFGPSRENIRIVDLTASDEVDVSIVGPPPVTFGQLVVTMTHSGLSKIQDAGQMCRFSHINPKSPRNDILDIKWMWEWDVISDVIQRGEMSDASKSLLGSILGDDVTENHLLIARPSASADILISKEVNSDTGCEMNIEPNGLTLWVQYDYYNKEPGLITLVVSTEPNGPSGTPAVDPLVYFLVNQPDEGGRQDGIGEFRRIYGDLNLGDVTVAAPETCGVWRFEMWTDRYGSILTTSPTLEVGSFWSGQQEYSVRAHYEYDGPLPGPADFNKDFSVDFMDYSALSSAWHTKPGDGEWDPDCDVSDPPDNVIDMRDMAAFAENWLTTPY